MNAKVILGVLALILMATASPTAVQAGGAAGAASFSTFFECQAINGAGPGVTVSTHEFDDTVLHSGVQVGRAVLKCRQVNVSDSDGFFVNPTSSTDLKCYAVNVKGPQGPSGEEGLKDGFFPSGVVVQTFLPLQYLCGPTVPFTP